MAPASSVLVHVRSGSSAPSALRIIATFVSDPNPVPSRPTSFTTTMSRCFAWSLPRPADSRSEVSAANPTRIRDPLRSPSSRRMSASAPGGAPASPDSFFSLPSDTAFGRKSATAAAITTTSASPAADTTARCISSAVSTCRVVTPGGAGTVSGPRIRRTSAPRDDASAATATPPYFLMARGSTSVMNK